MSLARTNAEFAVKLTADIADMKASLAQIRADLQRTRNDGQRRSQVLPGWQSQMSGIQGGLTRIRGLLTGMAGAFGVAFSVAGLVRVTKEVISAADSFAMMDAKLKLVTSSEEQRAQVQQSLFALAQSNRADLESTVGLYARLGMASEALRGDQTLLLSTVDRFQKILAISGVSTAESSAAITQFGQALSSGKLAGDEFKSMGENVSRILPALAAGIGVPTEALKKMAEDGKLTTEVIIKAIENQGKVIDEEFSKIPVTVSQAWTQVKNATLQAIGVTDQASGASRDLAQSVSDLSKTLSSPETQQGFSSMVSGLTSVANAAVKAMNWLTQMDAKYRGTQAHIGFMTQGENFFRGMKPEDELKMRKGLRPNLRGQFLRAENGTMLGKGFIKGRVTQNESRIDELERGQVGDAIRHSLDIVYGRKDPKPGPTKSKGFSPVVSSKGDGKDKKPKKGGGKKSGASPAELAAATANATEVAIDNVRRALKQLDADYEDGAISIADFFAQKLELQQKDLNLQIQAARQDAAKATTIDQRSRALTQLNKLERDRAELAAETAREQKKAAEELEKQYTDVTDRIAKAQGDAAASTRAALEREFEPLLKKLQLNGETAKVQTVRGYIDSSVSIAEIEALVAKAEQSSDRLQARSNLLSNEVTTGTISASVAQRQLNDLQNESAATLKVLRASVATYLEKYAPGSPEYDAALKGLNAIDQKTKDIRDAQTQLKAEIAGHLTDSAMGAWDDFNNGGLRAIDTVRKFLSTFLAAMARMMAAKQAAEWASKASGWLSKIFSFGAGVNHSGGIAGEPGQRIRQNINPLIFGAAPRFHTGGFPGLAPNEVAAVLQRGEEVITAQDPRHRRNGGGLQSNSANVGVTVNVSVNADGSASKNVQSNADDGRKLGEMMGAKALEVIHEQSRPGGHIHRLTQGH